MKGDTNGQGVVPLRTILRNILNLIDSFEARYKEGLDSYDQEFQELKQYSENLKTDPGYLCKEGEKSVNRKKNRYKDILPFDYTRVILADYGDIPGSDYINANFIKGASGSSAYIACQGPLPHTVNDFWRMVVECEVQVIVMACNEQESGKHKCENYWVEEEDVEREFGQVTVWLKKSRQVCPDFLVRTMKIRYPNSKGESEERSVCQFHYSAWPDHGVPLKVRPLLDMVRLIRDCQTSETLPVLVHCSAGCGRTGTICAIDYVWGLLRLGKLTSDFSLFNLVRDMRRQRIAMVQTKDQYILVHRAVRELFEEQLKIIDSHPYANVDINGLPLEIRADLEEPVYETVQFVPSPVRKDEDVVDCRKPVKALPPPIPTEPFVHSSVVGSKHEKEVENHERHLEQEKVKVTVGTSSSSSTSIKVNSTTPSPSTESQECASGSENKDLLDQEKDIISLPDEKVEVKKGSGNGKHGSKSSLLRNPSIVRLKAFFEKSKDPDKEKKTIPTLSRAKSDVSSSSRFYTNFANTFASRASRRNSPKNTSPTSQGVSSIEEPRERTPVEKIKSKPALLAKPNISVKRSKSLKIIRPSEEPIRDHVHLISATNLNSEVPDKANFVRASISSGSSSSSHSPLETKPIKVNVKQAEIPKLQKPHKTSSSTSKKPDIPLKPNLIDTIPSTKGIYGTTRIKIGISDDSAIERSSKHKGDFVKYGTVNPKILNSSGTLLTRSQSHVWQPTKEQVPVRIFSDENLSQVNDCRPSPEQKCNGESEHNVKLIRKQSLPITKLFSSKVKPLPVNNYEAPPPPKEQPRSLTLKSHTSFLEARKRLPKTNPYANYAPVNDFKEKGSGGSSLAQFHFGDSVPLLKNGNGNTIGNSSESSSNPGTPRNSLPGTPTQSIDVLYSPISLNTYNNYPPSRSHSRPILKGSLSSTPSESDERLDLSRPPVSSSSFQNQVPTNITGPQKISSVRIPVGLRERRNSFRQAVWKEDQGPTAKSIPVENDKSENIYITTTSSVPYSVKSSAMPFHDTSLPMNTSIKPVQPRSHRDYEPIWPDPTSSTNSFRIGSTTTTTTVLINADPQTHSMINKHPHGITSAKSNNPFLIEEKAPKLIQNSFDPKVQDRMAEIKVLLEELRAPAKVDEVRQRSMNGGASHIPLPKSAEKSSNGFSGSAFPVTPTTSTTGLKHHRSLRAPTRPQYQQSFACFTFRKPSSLESITDQLYAESNMHLARNHGKDMATSGGFETSKNPFRDDSLNQQQQNQQESMGNNHRFNDYVSLRTCRSNGKPEGNGIDTSHQIHHKVLSKSDSTPIPPPRSKRGGKMQGNDYENIRMNQNQQQQHHQEKYWMSNGVGNGQQQPRRLHNGTSATTSIAIRKESSSSSELDMLDNHCNGDQEFSRLTSSSSIPLTNGNGGGTGATSPKAIIRALGLFQAKAANVRSRFANWTENKERSASKRNGSALNRRHDRSSERGGFNDTHPTRSTTVPPPSVAGPSSTSKHQYL